MWLYTHLLRSAHRSQETKLSWDPFRKVWIIIIGKWPDPDVHAKLTQYTWQMCSLLLLCRVLWRWLTHVFPLCRRIVLLWSKLFLPTTRSDICSALKWQWVLVVLCVVCNLYRAMLCRLLPPVKPSLALRKSHSLCKRLSLVLPLVVIGYKYKALLLVLSLYFGS